MTPEQIRTTINADPALVALAQAGDTQALADALSAGRTKLVSHFASERGVLERFPGGPLAADALLAALEAFALTQHPMARIVSRALKFLAQPEGLDIGSPATLGLLDALTPDVLTTEQRDGLRAMATVADPITHTQVGDAVRGGL